MIIPPGPGEIIVYHPTETQHEVLYFDAKKQEVVTKDGRFPWSESSVLERRSDQELRQHARRLHGQGHPIVRHHPELLKKPSEFSTRRHKSS